MEEGEVLQDVLVEIMRRIPRKDQTIAACVCRSWKVAVHHARQPLQSLHVQGCVISDRKENSVDVGIFPKVGRSITIFQGHEFTEEALATIHRLSGDTLRGLHIVNTRNKSGNNQEESKSNLKLDFSQYHFPVLEYLHVENLAIASLGHGCCSVPALEHFSLKGWATPATAWNILEKPILDLELCLPELRACRLENVMLLSPNLFVQTLQKSPLLSQLRVWNSAAFPFLWPFPCQSIHLRNCKVLEWVDVAWFPAKFWLPKLRMATIGSLHLPSVPEVEFLSSPIEDKEVPQSDCIEGEPSRGAFVLTVLGRDMKVSKDGRV
uniref:F-box domain-containing protein n=1 Tax=Picocystis salinarum TaxID=88271 RepID=A0A7S3UCD2_9CHLO